MKVIKKLSLMLAAVMMVLSLTPTVFAAELDTNVSAQKETSTMQFRDALYADDDIAVFYGNPHENKLAAEIVENDAVQTASLRHDYIWVDAHTSTYRSVSIPASSSNPITYCTIKQEADTSVPRSYVYMDRPDGTLGFTGNFSDKETDEYHDIVVSSSTL